MSKNEWAIDTKLCFLGQSGFLMSSGNRTVVIDPYLSDSVGVSDKRFSRVYPVPLKPEELKADIFIVTHDHLDHLDPLTIEAYAHKNTTQFVGPRNAAKKLEALGISSKNITPIDCGDSIEIMGIRITGVFALATGADVLDTAGYLIEFVNGKSVYHTSDTAFCDLLLKSAPKADVLLTVINGKFGNLNVEQAVRLTAVVEPNYVIPHHFDVMALNCEHPESFRYFCEAECIRSKCIILKPLEEFEW